MKWTFILAFLLFSFGIDAQDYTINFSAQGDAVAIDEVKATNLTTNESVTIPGDASLTLHTLATSISGIKTGNTIWVAPNPYHYYTNLHVSIEKQQKISVSLTNVSGHVLAQYQKELNIGLHNLQISAESPGMYLIRIENELGTKNIKIVQSLAGHNKIEYIGKHDAEAYSLKSAAAEYILDFTPGDIISYSFSSGDLTTIVNETPLESKTITAEFYACTDGDDNNYPIVKIGEQIWMAENLKATKYVDGTTIPHISDNAAWIDLGDNNTDKAYSFYNNNESLGYGALYTYSAAVKGTPQIVNNHVQGVCPDGWHVPSDTEWTVLENYLIANGYNYDGTTDDNKIGKSLASTVGWDNSGDIGTPGNKSSTNNATGYSALPGGYRINSTGAFDSAGHGAYWWSSSENEGDNSSAYGRYLGSSSTNLSRDNYNRSNGMAVRCVKDKPTDIPHIYIDTDGGVGIISKDEYVKADVHITGGGKYPDFEGRTSIKGRGNSTWGMAKKPYKLKLDAKAPLLGYSAEKQWILLANYIDPSLMCNAAAMKTGGLLEMPFTNHIIPVDVTINGEYMGSYSFTEQKEVKEHRINVGEGGWLIELDTNFDEEWRFSSKNFQLPVMIQYPELDKMEEAEATPIFNAMRSDFNSLEELIFDESFPNNNYLDYFDAAAFVNYLIVYTLTDNEEINHPKSTYIYKKKDGKYNMGPIWDFDWAFGYEGTYKHFVNPDRSLFWSGNAKGTLFFSKIVQDPVIQSLYRTEWPKFKAEKYPILVAYLKAYAESIRESHVTDQQVWNKSTGDIDKYLNRLLDWLDDRVSYMDGLYTEN